MATLQGNNNNHKELTQCCVKNSNPHPTKAYQKYIEKLLSGDPEMFKAKFKE